MDWKGHHIKKLHKHVDSFSTVHGEKQNSVFCFCLRYLTVFVHKQKTPFCFSPSTVKNVIASVYFPFTLQGIYAAFSCDVLSSPF